MDALKVIMTRRSVRKFDSKPVQNEAVEKILHAAMSAPSATNEQPWHFLVIDDKAQIDKISTVHPHAAMCLQAPLVIIPCIDTAQEKYRDFWVQDMAAATQNILLAVRALELAAVWVGVYPNEERIQAIAKLFNLPSSVIPFCIIPIGYSDVMQREASERFRKDRVHRNRW